MFDCCADSLCCWWAPAPQCVTVLADFHFVAQLKADSCFHAASVWISQSHPPPPPTPPLLVLPAGLSGALMQMESAGFLWKWLNVTWDLTAQFSHCALWRQYILKVTFHQFRFGQISSMLSPNHWIKIIQTVLKCVTLSHQCFTFTDLWHLFCSHKYVFHDYFYHPVFVTS